MPEEHSKAPGERLPWGFVLDPTANATALGAVQRRGLDAARELVERVASTIRHPGDGTGPAHSNGATGTRTGQSPPVGDFVQDWWEAAARVLTELAMGAGPMGRPMSSEASTEVDVHGTGTPPVWRFQTDPNGQLTAPSEFWLRNPRPRPMGPLRLIPGDLRAPDGALISARCLRFDPAEVAELPARSARGVVVTLGVEQPLEPGTYRGVIQADGAPNLWIALELTVRSGPA